ncbi:MAG: DUF5682 family protein [Pseudomonadota bacterium]
MGKVHTLGIRHHGPGSARQVVASLEVLRPAAILIEGPSDLTDLIHHLAEPAMVPPVALLAYAKDAPERAVFWPFARFSPEYQAMRWALAHDVPVQFMDLPVAVTLSEQGEKDALDDDPVSRDPIGALAAAAGYEDGESWWSNVIEENPDPGALFDAVADAMAALREDYVPKGREALREAYMRRAIAKTSKGLDGPVAVVCGAWHVPALRQKVKASDDNALLRGLAKSRVHATWAPWTSPRLARATGYGAGVAAPLWYDHIWENGPGSRADAQWVARMAQVLREEGFDASTASLIETVRLTRSLAVVRDRPAPGFEEMRDAAISTLMMGEALQWRIIETRMLLGAQVGEIPGDLPLAPLLEDLAKQQRKLRLKPEALERDLSLDLRTETGLARSTLLHRLTALDVPWGKQVDPGRSRGTFRERWQLMWDPEYAVRLVEHLVYGPTVEAAAAGRLTEAIRSEARLAEIAERVRDALVAQLPDVASTGIDRLDALAAGTDDCALMLAALQPIVDTLRYGTARDIAMDRLEALLDRLITQAALALPRAARGLDSDEAERLRALVAAAHQAIALSERAAAVQDLWVAALHEAGTSDRAVPLVAGLAARLAYEAGCISSEEIETIISLRLSRANPASLSAGFFEGFFAGAGLKLVHDADLRHAVDSWFMSLDEEAFTENLPLFRRVFSTLDSNERKVLLEHLLGTATSDVTADFAPQADEIWAAQLAMLTGLFEGRS